MTTFFAGLSVYLLLRARSSQSFKCWAAAGGSLGLTVLTRIPMLPFAITAVVWVAAFGTGPTWQKTQRAILVLLVPLIMIGSWMGRNYTILGRPVLTSETGLAFWKAHNPYTFSLYPRESIDRSSELAYQALTPLEERERNALSGNELARSDWFIEKGVAFVRQNPDLAMIGAFHKVVAGFSWILNPRRGPYVQLAYVLSYAPVSILGVFGMFLAREAWRIHCLIYLEFFGFMVITAVFWAHTSHRSYLDVNLIVFASVTIEWILALRTRRADFV